ncbi:MAG: hypothetical protein QXW97_01885 [Candidatus Pacearchaeota archaeon]
MKNKINKKRGSILPDTSVKIIILVISFVILLLAIGYFVYTDIIKNSGCKDSIIIRNSINLGFLPVDNIVPLNCVTNKICLTQSGENCKRFGKPDKKQSIFNKKLDKDPEKAKKQVIEKIVEEMLTCQTLFTNDKGEPYYFMPAKWFDFNNKYCLICSRIVLDDEARKNINGITYGELYQKLAEKKIPNGRSYLDFLYSGWQDWRRAQDLYRVFKDKYPDKMPDKFEDWKIDLSKEDGIVIVVQMTTKGYLNQILASGAVLLGSALVLTYIGAPVGIALIGVGTSAGVTFWYTAPDERYLYSPPAIYGGDIDTLKSLECDSFEFSP